jgi:hypothetical protein
VPITLMREITFPGMVRTLRRGLRLFTAVVVVCILVTAIGLKLRPPLYNATMTVAPGPTDLSAASQLASEVRAFAHLATLAQTPGKIEPVSNLERYAQLFGSTALAARLEAEHHILKVVFADMWDPEHQIWRPPSGLRTRIEQSVLQFFGYPAWIPPDVDDLAEWLDGHIHVVRLRQSSLLRIGITDPRPEFAVSLINTAHRTADELLREDALDQIGRQIGQVESELATAANQNRKQALQAMLTEAIQAQALLRIDQPYVAEILVPAFTTGVPSSLNPLLALGLAALFGTGLGLSVVFLSTALRPGTL